MPVDKIKALQDELLPAQVRYVWERVPYYRKKMEAHGVTPDDIKSTADLYKLPFMSKADLRDAYPYGLLAVPLKDCVRIQSTSGVKLKPAPFKSNVPPTFPCATSATVALTLLCTNARYEPSAALK